MYRISIVLFYDTTHNLQTQKRGTIKPFEKLTHLFGSAILWLLILLGLLAHVLVIPANAYALQDAYSEYANDALTIQILLSLPVLFAQLVLIEILYLLRLIHRNRMFTDQATSWVRALTVTAFLLAGSIGIIAAWLFNENTLLPIVGFVLLTSFLLASAVGLVVISLLGLLRRATQAAQELEGVI